MDVDVQPFDIQPPPASNVPSEGRSPLRLGSGSGWDDEYFRPQTPPAPTLDSAEGRAMWATGGALAPVPPSPPQRRLGSPWMMPNRVWNGRWLRCDAELVGHMMNAAYTAAQYGAPAVRLNCHWHRPNDHDVRPLGYNPRGDIAPEEVHMCLDRALRRTYHPALETKLAHGVCDKVWLLHSRSERLEDAVESAFDFLQPHDRQSLVEQMRRLPLDDFRLVMSTIDPRKKIVYGQSLDSPAAPRMIPTVIVDTGIGHQIRRDDEGEQSGSDGDLPERISYLRPEEEQLQSARRRCVRRMRRLTKQALHLEDMCNQAEIAVKELTARLERAGTLRDTLLRGMRAMRGPLPLLEAQETQAWNAHIRAQMQRFREEDEAFEREQAERPPTPD